MEKKKKLKKYQTAGSTTTNIDPEGTQSNAPLSEFFGKGISALGITAGIGKALQGVSEKRNRKKEERKERKEEKLKAKYTTTADPVGKEGYDPKVNLRYGGSLMGMVSDLSMEAENTMKGNPKNKKIGMPLPKKNMGGRTNGSRTSFE